jgi:hypothetical protein
MGVFVATRPWEPTHTHTPFGTWAITHNGGNGAFFADVWRFVEEDLTVIPLSNATRPEDEDAAGSLGEAVFTARGDLGD